MKGRLCVYIDLPCQCWIMQSLTWSLPFSRIQFLVESSSLARRREKEKKIPDSTSITSIPFCLLFITNLSSIRSFSFRGHQHERGTKKEWRSAQDRRGGQTESEDRCFSQISDWKWDSIAETFINPYAVMQWRETDIYIKLSQRSRNVIPFNVIKTSQGESQYECAEYTKCGARTFEIYLFNQQILWIFFQKFSIILLFSLFNYIYLCGIHI